MIGRPPPSTSRQCATHGAAQLLDHCRCWHCAANSQRCPLLNGFCVRCINISRTDWYTGGTVVRCHSKKDTGIDWSVSLTVVNINGGSDRHVGPASQHAVISLPLLLVLFFDGAVPQHVAVTLKCLMSVSWVLKTRLCSTCRASVPTVAWLHHSANDPHL